MCLAVSPHQLTTRTSTCCTPALFQIVLEPTAATPPVVPLVPMSGQPTYLCSNRLSTHLRRPSYQCDPNSCPSILCDLHWFVCFALRRAPPFREILSSPFLPWCLPFPLFWFFPLPFQCSSLPLPLPMLGLPLSFVPVHPLVWLCCMYSVCFRQSLVMCPKIPHHDMYSSLEIFGS